MVSSGIGIKSSSNIQHTLSIIIINNKKKKTGLGGSLHNTFDEKCLIPCSFPAHENGEARLQG